ncbi:Lrp/AsnC family transcriptional regulator [Desulfobotulus sp. H1]|uniref:siroheme decarboxylase n=1 Tax=Desulfobotulus pelophilus TaxID=2823377 RepID=A0ABT3N934_9BACT|nr:Lrp/AsnC family transcriptional regulator [Desulfobotulus pelophilus]MCW7753967.1 Lrp/AsnC family transcriptional regulator [Desulfobotulus pelophilus]
MLTEDEKKIISAIQGDLPLDPRPYRILAESVGMDEDRFLILLKGLDERKLIRRYGATLRHQKSGFSANAMVAWKAPEDRVLEIGRIMAGFEAVSHCYRRDPKPGWPYNLYTMVHARTHESCRSLVAEMSQQAGLAEYSMLFSIRELKKTSMRYFESEDWMEDGEG